MPPLEPPEPAPEQLRWALVDRGGHIEFRAAVHDPAGLRLEFARPIAGDDRDRFLAFLEDVAHGRRGLFRASDGGLGLYADPRPEGARITMEWSGSVHATGGLTLSGGDVRRLLSRLSSTARG